MIYFTLGPEETMVCRDGRVGDGREVASQCTVGQYMSYFYYSINLKEEAALIKIGHQM